MGDNILFKQGKLANLPTTLKSGQILFAIKNNNNDTNNPTGSIYLDYKDGDEIKRAKLNADAIKLTTPIPVTIGNSTKALNTGPDIITWTHEEIGADVSLSYTSGSTSGPIIRSLINGVSDNFTFPSASATNSGVVNTGAQTFSGGKTFNNAIAFRNNIIIGPVNSATSVNNSYTNHNLIFVRARNNSGSNHSYGTFTLYSNNHNSLNLNIDSHSNVMQTTPSASYTLVTNHKGDYYFTAGSFYANFYKNGRSLGTYNSSNGRYSYNYYNSRQVLSLGTSLNPWGSLYLASSMTLGDPKVWNNSYQGHNNSNNPYFVTSPSITLYCGDNRYNASDRNAPYQYLKTILSTTPSDFYIQVDKQYANSDSTNTNASYAFGLNAFYTTSTNSTINLGTPDCYWNCGYINTVYGNLYGNANTATTLETSINFTIGNEIKSFDGSTDMSWSFAEMGADVSLECVEEVNTGIKITSTVNGSTDNFIFPSASQDGSGVVNTTKQFFKGGKVFLDDITIQHLPGEKPESTLHLNVDSHSYADISFTKQISTGYLTMSLFNNPSNNVYDTTELVFDQFSLAAKFVHNDMNNDYSYVSPLDLGTKDTPWQTLYLADSLRIGNEYYNTPEEGPYIGLTPGIELIRGREFTAYPINFDRVYTYLNENGEYVIEVSQQEMLDSDSTGFIMRSDNYVFSNRGFYPTSAASSLGVSSEPWTTAYITNVRGNLRGNADTASRLKESILITIGKTGKNFNGYSNISWSHTDIGANISNFSWTPGTSAGPALGLTINGVTASNAIIPSASTTESGIVTIGEQAFAGAKRFAKTICIGDYNANKDRNEVLGVHFVSLPLASNSPNFGEGQIGVIYDDSTKYLKLSFRNHISSEKSELNEIALDQTAFYPISDDKTLGTENKNWKTVYSKTYEINNAVTLQYNATNETLEFVFA